MTGILRVTMLGLSQVLVFALVACGTSAPDAPGQLTSLPTENAAYAMVGDPNFNVASMDPEERRWYERLWEAIDHEQEEATAEAKSGNTYRYGRALNLHITDLLTVFRVTGDLRLLDEVDRLVELMRDELRTTWVDDWGFEIVPNDGTEGFRRWLYDFDDGDWRGKDTHVMDDGLAHSLMAAVTYAYAMNRDLESPSGVDYGERADFWLDYLVNDFEAKWRIRHDNPEGTWPILDNDRPSPLTHTTVQWMRYHVYMYKLTGEAGYLEEARRMRAHLRDGLITVDTPVGDAFVWDHWLIDGDWGAQPLNYARYTMQGVHDLYLEGFLGDRDSAYMEKFANTVAHFVADNGSNDVAFDICGGDDCGGIMSRSGDRWSMNFFRPLAFLIEYDHTGELESIAEDVYADQSAKYIEIPAGQVFALLVEE